MSAGPSTLKLLRNILPQSQLCSVYYALVESHLRYGNAIWGSLCKTKLAALQRLQSRAWSIIEKAKIKDRWSCSWLNEENTIHYDWNVMTYKIINRLCPENVLINTCPDHVFLRTIREILRIFKSLMQDKIFQTEFSLNIFENLD